MKGIVIDKITKKVLYKFDTPTLPTLHGNEQFILRADINNIEVGADYNTDGNTYTNPPAPAVKDYKALFAAAKTDGERVNVIAQKLGLM